MELTLIKDLKSISKNVNLVFIVLEVSNRVAVTRENLEIRTCKVADRSACINLVLAGELGGHIQPGDICKLTKAHVGTSDGGMALFVSKGGELAKTGDFCMLFNESLNMSEINKIVKASTPATNNSNSNSNNPVQTIEVDS